MTSQDKRSFRRYHKISNFALKFNKGLFNAKTVDYSLDGLGAIVLDGDAPQMEKGAFVSYRLENPPIETLGEVVWSVKDGPQRRIGVRNVGKLKGLLRDFRISDSLIGLQRSRKTGILTVESGETVKKIYISNGDMVFSASNMDKDRLGDMLLAEGRLSQEQFDHSVEELKKTRQRQGAILVRLGYLKPDELASTVRRQVEEIILSLFELEEGKFVFSEVTLPTEEVITLKLSAANLIYHGIKRMISPPYLQSEIPSLGLMPRFSPDPLDLFQDLMLDFSGRKVISCIDGRTPLKEIIALSQLDATDVLRTVHALLSIRMIELETESEQTGIPREVMAEVLKEKTENAAPDIRPEVREMIEEMHRRYEGLGYYKVLGVKEHASGDEIKSAYYKTAKKFHPDMHFYYTDDSLKDKLSDIFAYVYAAYMTLSNPQKRREYDQMLTIRPAKLKEPQEKARAAFEEGMNKFRKGCHHEAELLFGQAYYYDGTITDYHYYYAQSLAKQGRFKDAEKALARALGLDPANPKYLAEQGFTFLELGFPARARGLFERALKTAPDNVRAMEGLKRLEGVK